MKLPTFKNNQKIFNSFNKNFGRMKSINTSSMAATIFTGLLISHECSAESLRLPGAEYSAEFSNIARANLLDVRLSLLRETNFLHQCNSQWVSNCIELLAPVSVNCQPMSTISAQPKRNNCPYERDEGGVGIKQKNKLAPEDTHKFWRLLFLGGSGTIVFFSAAYFCLRAAIKRDYAHVKPVRKARILGLMSALTIPRKIKNKRWQIWEQRQWFRDMKLSHGFDVAYLDTRHWKKLVAGHWG